MIPQKCSFINQSIKISDKNNKKETKFSVSEEVFDKDSHINSNSFRSIHINSKYSREIKSIASSKKSSLKIL